MTVPQRKKRGRPNVTLDERKLRSKIGQALIPRLVAESGLSQARLEELLKVTPGSLTYGKSNARPISVQSTKVLLRQFFKKIPTSLTVAHELAALPLLVTLEEQVQHESELFHWELERIDCERETRRLEALSHFQERLKLIEGKIPESLAHLLGPR